MPYNTGHATTEVQALMDYLRWKAHVYQLSRQFCSLYASNSPGNAPKN
jgi:hypothetical protein